MTERKYDIDLGGLIWPVLIIILFFGDAINCYLRNDCAVTETAKVIQKEASK